MNDSATGRKIVVEKDGCLLSFEDAVRAQLILMGENSERDGLIDTPLRVTRAWEHWTSGYKINVAELLTREFKDGGERYNEMVLVKDLPFYSHCEHHLAPFFGTASIAYIPNGHGKIVGLSKLGRLLEAYALRLQVQERLTSQIADALMTHLQPRGAACLIRARHLCMESRGLQKQGHETITSALRGVFFDDHKVRSEFLSLAKP
jgi:GTP cyclohydrolase I